MSTSRRLLPLLAATSIFLFHAENAWALYGQPAVVDVVDWIMAIVLVLLPAYIFLKVGFPSSARFRISLTLIILNVLVWLAAQSYVFYIHKTIKGFEALGPLGVAGSVLSFLWLRSIPISVLLVCLLSKQAKKMVVSLLGVFIVFCAVELGLNYAEINSYLSAVEKSDYKDLKHSTDIRNYLSASGIGCLRTYPRARTRKVLLAMLRSDSWVDRDEAALGLQYLRDQTVIPDLTECLRKQDADDTYDQARKECAVAIQMLLSGNYALSVYEQIEAEYKENPTKLFERLEGEAAQRRQ